MDRRKVSLAADVHHCRRDTCLGVSNPRVAEGSSFDAGLRFAMANASSSFGGVGGDDDDGVVVAAAVAAAQKSSSSFGQSYVSPCWKLSTYGAASPIAEACASEELQCRVGSHGPLCG